MELDQFGPGAVFKWPHDDRLMRVLMCDASMVMYDAWWPHLGNWGLADLQQAKRKRVHYYVTGPGTVAGKAFYMGLEPLSEAEAAVHRPDLPLSFARCGAVSWPREVPGAVGGLAGQFTAEGCGDGLDSGALDAPEIYLVPFGPKGGSKAGVRAKAENMAAFTAEEILRKAAAAQAPHLGDEPPAPGIGIYRLGLLRGIPSFYLWGAASQLESSAATRGKHPQREGPAYST